MFNNIGKKIKGLALFLAVAGMLISFVAGLCLIGMKMVLSGIIILVVGCLFSYIGAFVLYGFGELIDKTSDIYARLDGEADAQSVERQLKVEKLIKLRNEHLISDSEFQLKMEELQR